jgi:hypothetical protein
MTDDLVTLAAGGWKVSQYWPGLIVHHVSAGGALGSRNYEMLVKRGDDGWRVLASLPATGAARAVVRVEPLRRLLRRGVRACVALSPDHFVAFSDRRIYYVDPASTQPLLTGGVERGNGPLIQGCCHDQRGTFYYGEYWGTRASVSARIWRWRRGMVRWEKFYGFPAGSIRHIHSLSFDPFSERIWVTTGDRDVESLIGYFEGEREDRQLTVIASGSQRARAVSLMFTPEHVCWGSDAQDHANRMYRWSRKEKTIQATSTVGSPVFYSAVDSTGALFITTAAERMAHLESEASVWTSRDGGEWTKIATWQKHRYPTLFGVDAFGLGVLSLPSGSEGNGTLMVSGHSVRGAPGTWVLQSQ